MALAHLVLGLLSEGPSHGYDLKVRLDGRFEGSKPLPFAQVYATLSRLERDGLVEVAEVTQQGGPERTAYALTDAGSATLHAWLEIPEPAGPYPPGELARKAVVTLHLRDDAARYLQRQRSVHLDRMRELVRHRSLTADPSARLGIDYAINHLDADLRWLEEASARAADLAADRSGRGRRRTAAPGEEDARD